jgi:hypothetical protein
VLRRRGSLDGFSMSDAGESESSINWTKELVSGPLRIPGPPLRIPNNFGAHDGDNKKSVYNKQLFNMRAA